MWVSVKDWAALEQERDRLALGMMEWRGLCEDARRERDEARGEMEAALVQSEKVRGMSERADIREAVRRCFDGVTVEHPAVKGVLLLLGHQLRVEHAAAKDPRIGNDARNFNTGREAGLEDLLGVILGAAPKA